MQDVAQIGFFFTKKKSYLQLVPTGNSLLQTWKELDTSCLDYTFHFLFFSFPNSTSFERIRLHRVRNCGSVDRGTSENSVNMWICKYAHVAHWVKHKGLPWKWTFALSIFKMPGLVLNKDKLTLLKCLFFCIVWIVWADFGKLSCLALYIILSNIYLWVTPN